ncbi:ABC transporter ATP-binding protein [Skermanella pratensis]|uniref:ABC transporter ATP-binding protein n=1 Tax=Skermanella pratensis TaxID=2233999 RepID=UPI001300F11D|nr:ABC transporter ATP-binding protein [Skermanella pratensis]
MVPSALDPAPLFSRSPEASPLVTLSGIGKTYSNGTVALSGVDLRIGRSEFVSLLGPSGCGKSTVLRLIAGLGDLTAGSIHWAGGVDPKRGIGFVFQEPTLMPWATVADNVYLPLKLAGIGRRAARDRVAEALEMVRLQGFGKAYPRELSGGMKMRVSIARALITRPSVLLMDEPFAALDEITRSRLSHDLLELWHGRGWTVVFVTHSVFESVYLSRRIVVMAARPGRIIADLEIDAPYPRGEEFRTGTTYAGHCRAVSAELRRAMAGEEG